MAAAGRPKGSINKKSLLLLKKLEKQQFDVASELIEIYGQNKKILCDLVARMHDNIDNGRSPVEGFSEQELALYDSTNKDLVQMLLRMLAFLYPKLKALQIGGESSDQIVFNISTLPQISGNQESKSKPPHPGNVVNLGK